MYADFSSQGTQTGIWNDWQPFCKCSAWNEYLYAFLLLSKDTDITLPVALGNFLAADDSPWELLMTTGFIYALPPAAIYYAFRRYMVGGLTAGAVKS
jgi:multiple sugar transport system permease protein